MKTLWHYSAITSLIGLILLCLAWEGWLAPLRPGGSLLVVKAVPLLLPLFGILHGRVYTYQWASMLILLYFTEGVVRAWSESGLGATLGMVETGLSTVFFLSAIFYAGLFKAAKKLRLSKANNTNGGTQEILQAGNAEMVDENNSPSQGYKAPL